MWGGVGGLLPFALQFYRAGLDDFFGSIVPIGTMGFGVMIVGVLLGAIGAYAFRAPTVFEALYQGAVAPVAFAFVSGALTIR